MIQQRFVYGVVIGCSFVGLAMPALSDDESEVAVDARSSRQVMVGGARMVLLSAGYETRYTGDADPNMSNLRVLHYTFLVEPLGKDSENPALTIGPVQAFAGGTDTLVTTANKQARTSGKNTSVEAYDTTGWIGFPDVDDDRSSVVVEKWVGPLVAEPDRIDLVIEVKNRSSSGVCVFKNIRLK